MGGPDRNGAWQKGAIECEENEKTTGIQDTQDFEQPHFGFCWQTLDSAGFPEKEHIKELYVILLKKQMPK